MFLTHSRPARNILCILKCVFATIPSCESYSEFCWGLEALHKIHPHILPLALTDSRPQWLTTSFLRKEATQSCILNTLSGNTPSFLTHLSRGKQKQKRSGLAPWQNLIVLFANFWDLKIKWTTAFTCSVALDITQLSYHCWKHLQL